MNESQLELFGRLMGDTYCKELSEQEGKLIYGSNAVPSHRIVVDEQACDRLLDDFCESIRSNLKPF